MNPREEELFGILQEEAAEVIQVVSKRKRFPLSRPRNIKELHQELGDVFAVVQLLVEEGYVVLSDIEPAIQHKLEKLEKNMTHKRLQKPTLTTPAPADVVAHEELKDHSNQHREEDASK